VNAKRRVKRVRQLLEVIGIEGDRIRMFNLSSAMGPQFAQYAVEMTEQIRALGPSALRDLPMREAAGELSRAEEMTE
jgi:F420-non-reducing hydrogenase iron-sulfur subunit